MSALAVDPEAINSLLVQSIAMSVLGESMQKAIEKSVADLTDAGYGRKQTPLQGAVDSAVLEVTRKMVNEELRPLIEKLVRESITDEKISELVSEVIGNLHVEYKGSRF